MKKLLLPFIIIIVITSCKKDLVSIKEDIPVIVPASVVNYILTDSMLVNDFIMAQEPELYNNYYNKTFNRETNKVKANYKVEGQDIILMFEDTSDVNTGSEVLIKIANKTLLTITGNISALTNDVFYSFQQNFSPSSSVFSPGWAKPNSCNIQIKYDNSTKTLSGSITNLKYPFGIYVPYGNFPPPGSDLLLEGAGSFRKHTIQFQYVKSL